MRKRFCLTLAALVIAISARSAIAGAEASGSAKDALLVVRIAAFGKEAEYALMNDAELADTEKALRLEERCIGKAMSEAQRSWNTDAATKGTRFPINALNPRRATVVTKCKDKIKAQEKLAALLSKQAVDRKAEAADEAAASAKLSISQKARALSKQAEYDQALKLIQDKISILVAQEAEKAKAAQNTDQQKDEQKDEQKGGQKPAKREALEFL